MNVEMISMTFTAFPRDDAPDFVDDPRHIMRVAATMMATLAGAPVRVSYRVLKGKAAKQAWEMFELAAELPQEATDATP